MKKACVIIVLFLSSVHTAIGQDDNRNFGDILQSYHLVKDKDLIEKTIDFTNNTDMQQSNLEPILTGFFGALFLQDESIKKKILANVKQIKNLDIQKLFLHIASLNIDSVYFKAAIDPSYNDMNWSSYFATGQTKYLGHIIANIQHSENRVDQKMFLAGATAKWSLCSNAKKHPAVKEYLTSLPDKKGRIAELLNNDQVYFREQVINVIKAQRAKGIWND